MVWEPVDQLDMDQIERDRLLVRLVDQLLFRFIKLQDSVGERLVPATLRLTSDVVRIGCAGARCATVWRTSIRTRRRFAMHRW